AGQDRAVSLQGGALRRALVVLVLLAALPAFAAKKKAPPKPPQAPMTVSARVSREADGTRADLTWDGFLLGWAIPKDASRHRTLYALVGPAGELDAPPACAVEDAAERKAKSDARLFRWREDDPERLDLVRAGLPRGRLDAVDLDGTGDEGLVLVRDGGIDRVAADGGLAPLVTDPAITGMLGDPRAAGNDADARDGGMRVALPGELRTYGRGTTGAWRVTGSAALPVRVVKGSRAISLETPAAHSIGSLPAPGMLFATEPEPIGTTRVRTTLLAPDA